MSSNSNSEIPESSSNSYKGLTCECLFGDTPLVPGSSQACKECKWDPKVWAEDNRRMEQWIREKKRLRKIQQAEAEQRLARAIEELGIKEEDFKDKKVNECKMEAFMKLADEASKEMCAFSKIMDKERKELNDLGWRYRWLQVREAREMAERYYKLESRSTEAKAKADIEKEHDELWKQMDSWFNVRWLRDNYFL